MKETWKPLYLDDDVYEVSNTGRFREKVTGKLYTPFIQRGRRCISLKIDKKEMEIPVSRLVLVAFVRFPENERCHHVNGNEMDDRVNNLRWKPQFWMPVITEV